jgi:hypothetical protein
MIGTAETIPADGIFFDKALDRVFDARRPDAAELRAAIEKTSVMSVESFESHDQAWTRWDDAWRHWEEARSEIRKWFRDELAIGALDVYRRDPVTGESLKLNPRVFVFEYANHENPPVFFLQTDFERWLRNIQGQKRKGSPVLDRANKILERVFQSKIPDRNEMDNKALLRAVDKYLKENPGEPPLTDSTILRAAGRKK